MATTIEDVAAQVAAVEKKLDQALRGLTLLCRHLGALQSGGGAQSSGPKLPVATDADLDGTLGDPKVGFDPKVWADQGGESFKGRRLSQCSAEFLDCYAEALQFSADNPTGKKAKYVDSNRRDAMMARGWAMRIRGKDVPQGDGTEEL